MLPMLSIFRAANSDDKGYRGRVLGPAGGRTRPVISTSSWLGSRVLTLLTATTMMTCVYSKSSLNRCDKKHWKGHTTKCDVLKVKK
jgi:hypothetical protein